MAKKPPGGDGGLETGVQAECPRHLRGRSTLTERAPHYGGSSRLESPFYLTNGRLCAKLISSFGSPERTFFVYERFFVKTSLIKIFKKIRKHTRAILMAVLFVLILAGTAKGHGEKYNTNLKFDQNNPDLLVLGERKIVIEQGLSKENIKELNSNPSPDQIKLLMKSIAGDYNVDWKLVYAIGYHESANYNSHLAKNNNNYFGRKAVGGGYAKWSTPEEGVRNQFEYLKRRYIDNGLTTPSTINRVYAEDNTWHYKVESVMAKVQ